MLKNAEPILGLFVLIFQTGHLVRERIKGTLDKYVIYLFVAYSIEKYKINQYPNFSANSANVVSFYEVFCQQHYPSCVP